MSVGGQGLPRLQELAYLEVMAGAVAGGEPFEGIRLALVDHIWTARQMAPADDLPDPADYRAWRGDEQKFVSNITDGLKELMRLGFVEKSILPSSGKSAYAHKDARYRITTAGQQWVSLLKSDRRAAYDNLLPGLVQAHPAFACFLSVTGAIGDGRDSFVIPLLRWSELPSGQRSQNAYRSVIGEFIAKALTSSDLGWYAEGSEISTAVNDYLDRILARAQARDKDPFPTVRTFTQTCEEAVVRLALRKAGCPIDYISMEIARRWSRWLGLASFTYHPPGPYHAPSPYALRLWSTSRMQFTDGTVNVSRRAGGEWRDRVLLELHDYCQQARAAGTTYVPVWLARAAVCWKLRVVDDEFDRSITDMIAGRRGQEFPWRVHLDQVSVGTVPSSASPLILTTAGAGTRNYNVMTVVPKPAR